MLVELNKQDLINLVKGINPSHEQMSIPIIAANGNYYGGFNDRWEWNSYPFRDCTEQQIYDVYILLRNHN